MKELRVIIAGSREFDDFSMLMNKCTDILSSIANTNNDINKVRIVSGTARGADQLGEQYARACKYEVIQFPADWNRYGKSAGYIRNKAMAEYAAQETGVLFAFWDGESKGTKHMIDLAYKYGLDVHVINYNDLPEDDSFKILKP